MKQLWLCDSIYWTQRTKGSFELLNELETKKFEIFKIKNYLSKHWNKTRLIVVSPNLFIVFRLKNCLSIPFNFLLTFPFFSFASNERCKVWPESRKFIWLLMIDNKNEEELFSIKRSYVKGATFTILSFAIEFHLAQIRRTMSNLFYSKITLGQFLFETIEQLQKMSSHYIFHFPILQSV